MKGVSLAIETIVYLILAILVLTVLITFFLGTAGPAENQYTLEAKRNSLCGIYVSNDFACAGKDNKPVSSVDPKVVEGISKACAELNRRGAAYRCTGSGSLECIRSCCITCPNRPAT